MKEIKSPFSEQIALLERGVLTRPKVHGEHAAELLNSVDRVTYPLETARLFLVQGISKYYLFYLQDALNDLNEALNHFTHLTPKNACKQLNSLLLRTKSYIAGTHLLMGSYIQAIYSLRTICDEALIHNDMGNLAFAYLHLGKAYTMLGKYDQATDFLERALAVEEEAHIDDHSGGIYLCMGIIYSRTGKTADALEHLHLALELLEQHQYAETPGALAAIGDIYLCQNELTMAEQYASVALDLSREAGVRSIEAESLKIFGMISHHKGHTEDAHHFLSQALNTSRSAKNHAQSLSIAQLISSLSNDAHSPTCYLELIEAAKEIHLQSIESSITAIELQDKWDSILKDRSRQEQEQARLQQASERLQAVSILGSDIHALTDADAIIDIALSRLPKIIDADILLFYMLSPESSALKLSRQTPKPAASCQTAEIIPLDDTSSIAAYCARNDSPVLIRDYDIEKKFYYRGKKKETCKSWLAVPLTVHKELQGVVMLGRAAPHSLGNSDLHATRMCVQLIASALASANFSAQIKQISRRERMISRFADIPLDQHLLYDRMTGLPNRRLFFERGTPLLHQAERSGIPVAVCFLELHIGKLPCDPHNNQAGHEALKSVANRMKSILRKTDLLARIDADQYVAVFNDLKKKESVSVIMDKLNQEITRPFAVGDQICSFSSCGGISFFPEHGKDLAALIQAAQSTQHQAEHDKDSWYMVYEAEARQDSAIH